MTKEDFIDKLIKFKNDEESYYDIIASLNIYTKAIIAQSKCSTLRELLVQQLNRTPKGGGDTHKLVRNSLNTKRKTLSSIIKLLDELQPVA